MSWATILMFAFNNIETGDLVELFNENLFMDSILLKKSKCAGCKKYIKKIILQHTAVIVITIFT